ncbi:MAG TPA: SUMF1/EgtB/PvdO family nonheme iron enzyme [Thermoanaerobaculia bacterium]|jgi:formylglycine-generating enzyme required for sulfatase activity
MSPTPATFRYDAFLSYRRREPDRSFARGLLTRLEQAGFSVAIDERDFRPEQTFLQEMERCVRESRFTLALLSPAYFDSGNTVEESIFCKVLDLSERRRRLIPLILEPVELPVWLYDLVGIDFTDPQSLVDPHDRLLLALGTPNNGSSPTTAVSAGPRFPDARTRSVAEALEKAYRTEEELVSSGGAATAVRQEILALRRELREGGRLLPGDFLAGGRYRLLAQLGRGGFSTVWKAYDRERRDLVAVKVLHGQHSEDRSRRERFFRGARKMAELHHPGIVRVLEQRLDDGGYHLFVMELLPGGDLREAVLGKRLLPQAVMPLLQEVAAALEHAHTRGVIHRDVKPANILLDAQGHPKLTDFDLVRAADTTGGTMAGGMLGTFIYAAPEAMSSPQETGVAGDVYSLAMTAAFCLHGAELPVEVLRDTRSFLRKLSCAPGLRTVLTKALSWEPEKRFTSVAELAQALAQGQTAPVRPASAAKRKRPATVPRSKDEPPSLRSFLEKEIVAVAEAERPAAVLRVVEKALEKDPEADTELVGLMAWALDYFPGRSPLPAVGQEALRLRETVLAPLWERVPAPTPGDPDWAAIPSGSFLMGTPENQSGGSDERPPHRVTLSPFRLLAHPVTNREYRRLVRGHPGEDDLPAIDVTWYQAYAYAAWLGGRLPTEAEWEYACRAGSEHPYCDRKGSPTTLDKVGWYEGNSGRRLHPVAQLEPNPWGLFDMIGNVWEWVADWYGPYSAEPQADPWGPPSGGRRVLRGGSYWVDADRARAACRLLWYPGFEYVVQSFRVLLPAGPGFLVVDHRS